FAHAGAAEVAAAASQPGRYARTRGGTIWIASRDDRAASVGRADADYVSRTSRQGASRGAAARDAKHQAGRSRAVDWREFAGLGTRLLCDSLRGRSSGAARPSDFRRGTRADHEDCGAGGGAAIERGAQ